MSLAGTFEALGAWFFERGPLRAVIVKWILLALGIGATVAVWCDPSTSGNLARHASVTMSTACDDLPDFSPFPAEPSRLVDGKKDRAFDACTAMAPASWVELDLGVRATLDEVVVSGREDCCWAMDTLPLVMEVSEDGREYREVRRRTLPFTRDEPWNVALDKRAARFIRLRVDSPDSGTRIVLTEIEVYGHPIQHAQSSVPPQIRSTEPP